MIINVDELMNAAVKEYDEVRGLRFESWIAEMKKRISQIFERFEAVTVTEVAQRSSCLPSTPAILFGSR